MIISLEPFSFTIPCNSYPESYKETFVGKGNNENSKDCISIYRQGNLQEL